MTNFLSYDMANLLQWQGLGDIINAFRSVTLGLEPLTQKSGPYVVDRLKIPYTYCWSEGLIQKPPDWGSHVGKSMLRHIITWRRADTISEISGFYFMEADTDFKPEQELVDFLKGGEAPIYIGYVTQKYYSELGRTLTMTRFGSVVVEDAEAMTSKSE